MSKLTSRRSMLKVAVLLTLVALVISVVFLSSIPRSNEENFLNDAIEGGESSLTAIGRSHESLTNFADEKEESAKDVLGTALTSQEQAKAKLVAAGIADDDFVLKMVENYELLLNASYILTQGAQNLISISDILNTTLKRYRVGANLEAAELAPSCLQILTPLVSKFESWNESLDAINYQYIASGHRESVQHAVSQYREGMKIYLNYISLLESIVGGKDYSNAMDEINDLFDQLQHAIATNDYASAQKLLQDIYQQLQAIEEAGYPNATSTVSNLDPSALGGLASVVAQDLKNSLKDSEGIRELEAYFDSLSKYLEALELWNEGNLEEAENAIEEGLLLLGQEEPLTDSELQKYYNALTSAFLQLKSPPSQG